MDKSIIITNIAPIITSIGAIIIAFMESRGKKRAESNQKLEQEIKEEICNVKEVLTEKIDSNVLNQDKRFLVQFMDRAERGEAISREEMQLAFDTKEEYNDLGRGQLCRCKMGQARRKRNNKVNIGGKI